MTTRSKGDLLAGTTLGRPVVAPVSRPAADTPAVTSAVDPARQGYEWTAHGHIWVVDYDDLRLDPKRKAKELANHFDNVLLDVVKGGYIKDEGLAQKVTSVIDPPLHLDFETCSECDLRKAGASRYAQDPTTKVLAVSWAIGDGPISKAILPGTCLPPAIRHHIEMSGRVHAWNANFEMAI